MAGRPGRLASLRLRYEMAAVLLVCTTAARGFEAAVPITAPSVAQAPAEAPSTARPIQANFNGQVASKDARRVADWAVSSQDNADLPFVIIDKAQAKVFVFDSIGMLQGATLALLGLAHGDDSVPGIGDRKLSAIPPKDRTTPAGRFVASLGHDLETDILWIDYKDAISLHRVINGTPGDHRLQRLATLSPLDKRITFGCINVPVRFYENVILKAFNGTVGVVYILPEIKTIDQVFPLANAHASTR